MEEKRHVFGSPPATSLSQMPNQQICQRIWEMPPVLFSFIKMCKHFVSTNHTWELWKVIWFCDAWQLSINAMISFSLFFFWGKKIWMNYSVTFQNKTTESWVGDPELFKAYLHNLLRLYLWLQLLSILSQENFWDSHLKRILFVVTEAGFSQNIQYKWQSEIFPLQPITRNASTLRDCESLCQHDELPDKEVADLHHSKTRLFPITTTENSHAPVF